MKTLVPMYLTVQMHFICISETFLLVNRLIIYIIYIYIYITSKAKQSKAEQSKDV